MLIKVFLIVAIYRLLMYIIFGPDTILEDSNANMFKILVYMASWASSRYIYIICRENLIKSKNKTQKINYSLSSPKMREALSLKSFIK